MMTIRVEVEWNLTKYGYFPLWGRLYCCGQQTLGGAGRDTIHASSGRMSLSALQGCDATVD